MSRTHRLLFTLLGVCISLAVSALLLEAGVLLFLGEQVRFPRHVVGAPFGVRINEPGASYRHKSGEIEVRFRINSRGLRADREFSYAKPVGVQRIVSLGDSFTVGYEVEVEETFSSILERELQRRGYRVEVLNAGVSGYSNAEALVYLERELLRYEPDLVLVSFFGNDPVDNLRSGLFRLEGGELVEHAQSYVPAGALGDLLNTNRFFNLLSERSNAFALLKERLTVLVKRQMVRENEGNIVGPDLAKASALVYQRQLVASILKRLYAICQDRRIPLVIQSIPTSVNPGELVEMFPLDHFEVDRPGLVFFPALSVLAPMQSRTQLYYERSHGHWTPASHRAAGEELARRIDEGGLL